MQVKAIVATGHDGAIGCRGAIPWDGCAPRDMRYFMDTTRNSAIIMGRITADSLKLPFKTRKSIIITTKKNETLERYGHHSDVVGSLEEAIQLAQGMVTAESVKDIFIIGGAQIYREAMEKGLIDVIHLTTIHGTFNADAFFRFDRANYDLIAIEHHAPDEKNKYGCTFETFQKKAT